MGHSTYSYGPVVVQLLQARGLNVREHLPSLLERVTGFSSQGSDAQLTGRYIVGLVAAIQGPSGPETDSSEAWCGAVEAMFRDAHPRPAALVVESDPIQRRYAATVLTRAGMTVNPVDHADGAWLCDTLRYEFILMDYAWPTGRGAELAEEIRAGHGPNTDTYILGSSGNLAKRECMAAGMDDFVQKPIDLATLKMRALRAASGMLAVTSVP